MARLAGGFFPRDQTGSVLAQRDKPNQARVCVTEALDGISVMLWREQGKMRRAAAAFAAVMAVYARDGPLPRSGSLVTEASRIG